MKLFVGNLPFSAIEADVRELFEAYGPVTDFYLPLDRTTGRPRGFAFVTLSSRDKGLAAVEGLNGQEFMGRPLRINEALERSDRPAPSGPRGGGGGYRGQGQRGGGGGDRGDRRGPRDRGFRDDHEGGWDRSGGRGRHSDSYE